MNNLELDKKVKQLVHSNRFEKGVVCSVDILLQMDFLSKKEYDDWRFGKIEYLEKACKINLSKLTLINKSIKKHSLDIGLESSWTGYNQFGKGIKRRLRFSKSGNKNIEDGYATHYLDKKRINELKTGKAHM